MRYIFGAVLLFIFFCASVGAQPNYTKRINIGLFSPAKSIALMDGGGYFVGGYYSNNPTLSPVFPFFASIDESGNVRWSKVLSGATNAWVTHVARAGGGFYYAAGMLSNSGVLYTYVMKLDSLGQKVWVRSIQNNDEGQVFGFCAAKDGGCFIAQSFDITGVIYAIKFNPDGTVDWRTTLPEAHSEVIAATTLVDSSYVFTGFSDQVPIAAPIVRLSSRGRLLWYEQITPGGDRGQVEGDGITSTREGGFAITGSTSGNNGLHDVYVAKFDSNGNELWSNAVDLFDDEGGADIIERSTGELEIVGFSRSSANFDTSMKNSAMFMKVGSDGEVRSSSLQSFPRTDLVPYGMVGRPDSRIVMVGYAGDSGVKGKQAGMLMEFYSDATGPCRALEVLNSVHAFGGINVVPESVENDVTETVPALEVDATPLTSQIDLCELADVLLQPTSQNEITLYPNPLPKDAPLNIIIPIGWPAGEYELSIGDVTGKIITDEIVSIGTLGVPIKYEFASASSGMYLLTLASKSEPAMKRSVKFVKE